MLTSVSSLLFYASQTEEAGPHFGLKQDNYTKYVDLRQHKQKLLIIRLKEKLCDDRFKIHNWSFFTRDTGWLYVITNQYV